MTPWQIAAKFGKTVVPQMARLARSTIRPQCVDCDVWVDVRKVRDAFIVVVDGKQHAVVLCRKCLKSLDDATHEETLRRLDVIKAKVEAAVAPASDSARSKGEV